MKAPVRSANFTEEEKPAGWALRWVKLALIFHWPGLVVPKEKPYLNFGAASLMFDLLPLCGFRSRIVSISMQHGVLKGPLVPSSPASQRKHQLP